MHNTWNVFSFLREVEEMMQVIAPVFMESSERHTLFVQNSVLEESKITFGSQFQLATSADEKCTSSSGESDYERRFNNIFDVYHDFCKAEVIDQCRLGKKGSTRVAPPMDARGVDGVRLSNRSFASVDMLGFTHLLKVLFPVHKSLFSERGIDNDARE